MTVPLGESHHGIAGQSGAWRAAAFTIVLFPMLVCEEGVRATRIKKLQRNGGPCAVLEPGAGVPGLDREVHALEVFGRPGEEVLVAGGFFNASGSAPAMRLASWDGTRWDELGGGVGSSTPERVDALLAVDGPGGPLLHVGGIFATVGRGIPAANVASWDGTSWTPLGQGLPPVNDFAIFDDGCGSALYAATNFSSSTPGGVWRFDGSAWSIVGGGVDDPLLAGNGFVRALAVFQGELVAGGAFTVAGGEQAFYVASWDGERWSELGGGLNEPVFSLATFDDGSGEELYCGGTFLGANSPPVPAAHAARWNGSRWASLGNEDPFQQFFGNVLDIEVFDDGDGPSLYFAGDNGFGSDRLFEWTGGPSWKEVAEVGLVFAMAAHDDGAGLALHLGGSISSVGGVPTSNLARLVGCGPSLTRR